jgi:hypothetical protein
MASVHVAVPETFSPQLLYLQGSVIPSCHLTAAPQGASTNTVRVGHNIPDPRHGILVHARELVQDNPPPRPRIERSSILWTRESRSAQTNIVCLEFKIQRELYAASTGAVDRLTKAGDGAKGCSEDGINLGNVRMIEKVEGFRNKVEVR